MKSLLLNIKHSSRIAYFLTFLVLGLSLIFLSVQVQLPDYLVPINPKVQTFMKTLLPQGWGFFTKTPTDPTLVITPENKSADSIKWPLAQLSTGWGLDRIGRVQSIEFGSIENTLPPEKEWQNASHLKLKNLKFYARPALASNWVLKGRYIVQYRKIIPWGLSTPAKITNSYKEIGVDIE